MNEIKQNRKCLYFSKRGIHIVTGLLTIYVWISLTACTNTNKTVTDHILDTANTNYIDQLNQSAFILWSSNPDSLILLSKKGLKLSTDLNYYKGKATSLMILGVGYHEKGAYTESVDHYQQAIQYAQAIPNDTLEARWRNNISMPLIALGAYEEVIENIFAALTLSERHDLLPIIAHAYNNLGNWA